MQWHQAYERRSISLETDLLQELRIITGSGTRIAHAQLQDLDARLADLKAIVIIVHLLVRRYLRTV